MRVWDRKSAGWARVVMVCGAGLNFTGAGRERTQNFNPRRTLERTHCDGHGWSVRWKRCPSISVIWLCVEMAFWTSMNSQAEFKTCRLVKISHWNVLQHISSFILNAIQAVCMNFLPCNGWNSKKTWKLLSAMNQSSLHRKTFCGAYLVFINLFPQWRRKHKSCGNYCIARFDRFLRQRQAWIKKNSLQVRNVYSAAFRPSFFRNPCHGNDCW